MSTDGDPAGPPADGAPAPEQQPRPPGAGPRRQFTERERAINALAYPLAGTAAAAVVIVIAVALLDPTPGRHVRGLLILLALVGLLAAACGWVRTVWHGPTDDPGAEAAGPSAAGHPDHAGPRDVERQIVRHVE